MSKRGKKISLGEFLGPSERDRLVTTTELRGPQSEEDKWAGKTIERVDYGAAGDDEFAPSAADESMNWRAGARAAVTTAAADEPESAADTASSWRRSAAPAAADVSAPAEQNWGSLRAAAKEPAPAPAAEPAATKPVNKFAVPTKRWASAPTTASDSGSSSSAAPNRFAALAASSAAAPGPSRFSGLRSDDAPASSGSYSRFSGLADSGSQGGASSSRQNLGPAFSTRRTASATETTAQRGMPAAFTQMGRRLASEGQSQREMPVAFQNMRQKQAPAAAAGLPTGPTALGSRRPAAQEPDHGLLSKTAAQQRADATRISPERRAAEARAKLLAIESRLPKRLEELSLAFNKHAAAECLEELRQEDAPALPQSAARLTLLQLAVTHKRDAGNLHKLLQAMLSGSKPFITEADMWAAAANALAEVSAEGKSVVPAALQKLLNADVLTVATLSDAKPNFTQPEYLVDTKSLTPEQIKAAAQARMQQVEELTEQAAARAAALQEVACEQGWLAGGAAAAAAGGEGESESASSKATALVASGARGEALASQVTDQLKAFEPALETGRAFMQAVLQAVVADDQLSIQAPWAEADAFGAAIEALCSEDAQASTGALFALQGAWHAAGKPKGVLEGAFMKLYMDDLVDEAAFEQWKDDEDDSTDGKTDAIFATNRWFMWLAEQADSDEDESDEESD